MGKCLTSLGVLAALFLSLSEVVADEQVRRVQQELRKRHLFYADPNGQKGPALTVALKYYQAKKGFAPSGVIDPITLASLGISPSKPSVATTPATAVKRGQIHGANGERLPGCPPFLSPNENRANQFDPGLIGRDYIEIALTDFSWQRMERQASSRKSIRQASSPHESDVPAEGPFEVSIRPVQLALASPMRSPFLLQLGDEEFPQLGEFNDKRMDQADATHPRRTHRRTRRTEPRKEKNPLVLTYRSVDRAIRSLFGDTQTKKKRSTTKRL